MWNKFHVIVAIFIWCYRKWGHRWTSG